MEFKKTGKWSEMGSEEKQKRFNRFWYGKSDYDKYITYVPNEYVNRVKSFDKFTSTDSHGGTYTTYKLNLDNGDTIQGTTVEEFRANIKKYFKPHV